MIKVVLDTNILVSSLLAFGPPAAIVDLAADGRIVPFYNDLIIQEYWSVLSRKKFGFSPLQVIRLVKDIVRIGIGVETVIPSKIPLIDEDDRIFYDTATNAGAYLITGNIRHFPKELLIVTPAQFLDTYRKKEKN